MWRPPSRLRHLHAALVIAVRHAHGRLTANERAGAFDPADPATARLIERLKVRCRKAGTGRTEKTVARIHSLAARWADAAERCREQRERRAGGEPKELVKSDSLLGVDWQRWSRAS